MHFLGSKPQRCCFLEEFFIITSHGFLLSGTKAWVEGINEENIRQWNFCFGYVTQPTVICLAEEELMAT
jgi:hypothetical protein